MFTFYPVTQNYDDVLETLTSNAFKEAPAYPPYNIYENDENGYIEMAVTGLSADDLQIYFDEDNYLVIEGEYKEDSDRVYKHRGLSKKNFKRKFRLEKNYEVQDVKVSNGLLEISLKHVEPERKLIPINQD